MEDYSFFYASSLIFAGFLLYIWFVKPVYVHLFLKRWNTFLVGAKRKTVITNGMKWSYIEKGSADSNRPSMLFVHGFEISKENWIPVWKHLKEDQHVIAMDMPGHGDTDEIEIGADAYNPIKQAVHQFVCGVGLDKKPFHIIGMSMGGATTLCYAGAYPQEVFAATIICPGILTPTPSELLKTPIEERAIADFSVEGFKNLFNVSCYSRPSTPTQLMKGLVEANKHHIPYWTKFAERALDNLNGHLGVKAAVNIKSPSQVIWGAQDKLIHPSGADLLREKLPNLKEVHIIPECGHDVMVDQPFKIAELVTDFSRKTLTQKKMG